MTVTLRSTFRQRRSVLPAIVMSVLLAASVASCAASSAESEMWPPSWQDTPQHPQQDIDFTTPPFEPPSATHCHRLPSMREVPGGGPQDTGWRRGREVEPWSSRDEMRAKRSEAPETMAAESRAAVGAAAEKSVPSFAPPPWRSQPSPQPQPQLQPQRPARETVTAGMVDDNADFGEYLAYRRRNAHLSVRERDISERYLLEVTDAQGYPVHDAEVAVQRQGIAQPVMWARTDTAGHVWLHPRAFMSPEFNGERTLGVAVRKGGMQSRALLMRGQSQAVQVRLGSVVNTPTRLDLVFLVDATGSMGDEIAKLKQSMRAMAQQISQLPGQPDICYGLVAYRDRGDAFITRTHDFTDDLGAFQQQLANVQAHGGGDVPEALNEALHEVVHGLSWRAQATRMVVLVADAPPHLDYGGPQYDRDMQAAVSKGIKLFAVGASGLDPVGEYIYRQMAQYTAGRFVFLTYRDASNPGSGPGSQTVHDVKQYSVQTLDRLVVRLVGEELGRLKRG
ncbi:MAG: vWA domain-containing protein [Rhizobacter sp.]